MFIYTGTLDKLESIPGYRVNLSLEEIKSIVEDVGCCIAGQTKHLCPADKYDIELLDFSRDSELTTRYVLRVQED